MGHHVIGVRRIYELHWKWHKVCSVFYLCKGLLWSVSFRAEFGPDSSNSSLISVYQGNVKTQFLVSVCLCLWVFLSLSHIHTQTGGEERGEREREGEGEEIWLV